MSFFEKNKAVLSFCIRSLMVASCGRTFNVVTSVAFQIHPVMAKVVARMALISKRFVFNRG